MKLLIALGFFALSFVCLHGRASATICNQPNSLVNGGYVDANGLNTNFQALVTCGNAIDNTNIGSAGIFASQIKPITVANATFGSGQVYTFPGMTGGPSVIIDMSGALGNGGLELIDTTNTAVTPAKYIRADGVTGALEIVNSAGNAIIGALSDIGAWAVAGSISAFGHPVAFDPRYTLQPSYHVEAGAIINVGGGGTYNVGFTTPYTTLVEDCQLTPASYGGSNPTSGVLFIQGYVGAGPPYTGMTIKNGLNAQVNVNYHCEGY